MLTSTSYPTVYWAVSNHVALQEGEDGEDSEEQWVLERAEAGAVVSGLAVQLLDSAGAPVTQPVRPLTRHVIRNPKT